jgi:hypothetical protein
MRVKAVTPLGLAFVFAALLAGWASAANGLQAPSGHAQLGPQAGSPMGEGKAITALRHQTGSTDEPSSSGDTSSTGSDPASDGSSHHGGPIQRFHDAGSCQLPNSVSLPGNWTHGDYVGAWAATGNPAAVQAAAPSSCGKPVKGHGHSKNKHGKGGELAEHGHNGNANGHGKSKHHSHGHKH